MFIDDKGRLFGKINVIDFFVIAFFVFLLPFFYFGYKLISKTYQKKIVQNVPLKKLYPHQIYCRMLTLNEEMIQNISVGDVEVNEKNEEIGRIVKLGALFPSRKYMKLNLSGYRVYQRRFDHPVLKERDIQLDLKVFYHNGNLFYKNFRNPIIPLRVIDLDIKGYAVRCRVRENGKGLMRWQKAKVRFQIHPVIQEAILEGDLSVEKAGATRAKIEIIHEKIAYRTFLLPGDLEVNLDRTLTMDIVTTVNFLCEDLGKNCRYDQGNLRIGRHFQFETAKYIINGIIVNM